jgi:hypothetical protein
MSYVYVAQDKGTEGVVKIGKTDNPKNRVLTIRGSLPWPQIEFVALYHFGKMATYMERKLHATIQAPRKQYPSGRDSEWYEVTDIGMFLLQVELICYSELLVLDILNAAGTCEGVFNFMFPNLLTTTIAELLEICKRNDEHKRLWFYQFTCPPELDSRKFRLGLVEIHTVNV